MVIKVMEVLKVKYERKRIEKIEEYVKDWLDFKEAEYDSDDELMFAMKELVNRKKELKVSDEEWSSVWMLGVVQKRKSMEAFQCASLRDVVKTGGADVVEKFGERFREMRVEGHRSKVIDTHYMGSESASRKIFQQKA